MEQALSQSAPVRYAAFKVRFRALRFDLVICLALFIVGGLIAAIVFERAVTGRVAAFAVIATAILLYEPVMVARYGGTFGHRRSNIRIICASSGRNLPFARALLRSFVKQIVGLISLAFMFVTSRAQGLHDLAAGASVVIHDPSASNSGDVYTPTQPPSGALPTLARRIVVIFVYNILLFTVVSIAGAFSVSHNCLDRNVCSSSEDLSLSLVGSIWILVGLSSVILGWTGRLPGCRRHS